MFSAVPPPTQKSLILTGILKFLSVLTLLQGLFLMFTNGQKSIIYFGSFITYIFTICKLSYFGCIVNQGINLILIWLLLLQMAIKLKSGLYEVYLSSEGFYKMSSLIFGIICLYFNFISYKDLKQIGFEIYLQQNENKEENEKNSRNFNEGQWNPHFQ